MSIKNSVILYFKMNSQSYNQGLVNRSPAKYLLLHGGWGTTRSAAMLKKFEANISRGRRWHGIIFRNRYKELDNLIQDAKDLFIAPYTFTKSPYPTFRFSTGSELRFQAIERIGQYSKFWKTFQPFLGFDGLSRVMPEIVQKLITRLRAVKGIPAQVVITSNSSLVYSDQVREKFKMDEKKSGELFNVGGEVYCHIEMEG